MPLIGKHTIYYFTSFTGYIILISLSVL